MGIMLDEKTVKREKRYTGFNIQKHDSGENTATATIAIGYYDEFDGVRVWITEKQEQLFINNDQLTLMMGLRHTDLGLAANSLNLFKFLDTAIYGIISGQLRLDFSYTATVKDKTTGEKVPGYHISITRADGRGVVLQYIHDAMIPITGSALLNATVTVTKDGYETFSKTYPVLHGETVEEITLKALPNQTPPVPEPVEETEEPTEPAEEPAEEPVEEPTETPDEPEPTPEEPTEPVEE